MFALIGLVEAGVKEFETLLSEAFYKRNPRTFQQSKLLKQFFKQKSPLTNRHHHRESQQKRIFLFDKGQTIPF